MERLRKTFRLEWSLLSQQLKELEAELFAKKMVEDALKDSSETQKAYSIVEEELEISRLVERNRR